MHQLNTRLSGPDFLDAVADAELAQGNAVNADIYRQRARDWRQDLADLDRAQQRIAEQTRAMDKLRAQVNAGLEALRTAA